MTDWKESDTPNPGGPDALDQGCTCPVYDNNGGDGSYKGVGFITSLDCPLHGDETIPS